MSDIIDKIFLNKKTEISLYENNSKKVYPSGLNF
jgi:hypothetical protein